MSYLEGVLVLDLTRLLPGPYCSWLLRGWGARVVKIEDTGAGDYLRDVMPVWFAQLNAGAESVALDLKREAGREVFLRLVRRADVVLEGFRPGAMERLGLGYEALKAANPRVVLVSVSGFGAGSDRAGHDLTYLARSGLLSLMGEVPPVQMADLTGGMLAAAGALAALNGARQSGIGSHVQTSLLESLFALGALHGAEAQAGYPPVREQMLLGGAMPCYSVYTTADGGRMALGALEAKFWQVFCRAVGREDWIDRQLDLGLRPELEELFRSRTLAVWTELSARTDCCLEPVLPLAEAVRGRASFHPAGAKALAPAPGRGADTQKFLAEAGFTEQEIMALAAEGVI